MHVTLIFPPATDPRAPHLALPYLAAVLRRAGISTRLIDADVGSLLALLRPDAIGSNVQKLKLRPPAGIGAGALSRLVRRGEALVENIPRAFAILRGPKDFYDAHQFRAARAQLLDGIGLACLAADRPIHYSLCPIRYDIDGIDEQSLHDLIAVTADRHYNLFHNFWEDELLPSIEAEHPDLVGISIVNRQQLLPGLALASRLRERGLFVVLGGTVFTKFVGKLMQLPEFFAHFADGVIVYEGETAILELVAQLGSARDFSRVPNFLHVRDGRVHLGKAHVEDVDELPVPDFAGLPLKDYLTPEPVLPILVGKGCYFNECKFCDIPFINHVSKKPYRVRSPQKITQDILSLNERFGCRHFEITDEALPPRLLEKLADELEPHAGRQLSFTGYARLEPGFTAPLCAKLARMGMRKLFFGLESGDQATLDHMKKGIRLEHVRPVLEHCRDAGILFHIFSIIGFPEETEARARNTLRFFEDNVDVIDHPGNTFDIHPFGLELRTEYFANADRIGLNIPPEALNKEFVIGIRSGWSNTRGLSPGEVGRLVNDYNEVLRRIYGRFHNSDLHLWPGFEEYAVLYADHYADREFPFRTALPEEGDPSQFTIAWCPDTLIEFSGGTVRISSPSKIATISERAYRMFASGTPRTQQEFFSECLAYNLAGAGDGAKNRIRRMINALIRAHLLQLTLTGVSSKGPDGARAGDKAAPAGHNQLT
jgi:anaerobic magnesium-protoporphyrin IX monomethyl ester cyclase